MQSELFERLQRIDHFIQIKGTGNAAELAHKLGISRTNVYEHLRLMKELGAPIKFCNYRQSYYYDEEGSFITQFLRKTKNEAQVFKNTAMIVNTFCVIQLLN